MKKLILTMAFVGGLAIPAINGNEAHAGNFDVRINLGTAHGRVVRRVERVIVPAYPAPYRVLYPGYQRIEVWQDGPFMRVRPGVYPAFTPGYRFYY